MAKNRIQATASSSSVAANTVLIGPIGVDDPMDVSLVSITGGAGSTTPTHPKIQIDLLGNNNWVDVASGAITPSTSASTAVLLPSVFIVCKYVRVVSAGAFGAGDASLEFLGVSR